MGRPKGNGGVYKKHVKKSSFQKRFSNKIRANYDEMHAGTGPHIGRSHHLVHNRAQLIAISASEARKGMG